MNAVLSKMSPSITRLIRGDHSMVLSQFHKLGPSMSAMVREAVVRNICGALEIHAQLEQEIFYPALRDAGVQSPALDKSVPEHDEVRRLVEHVRSLDQRPSEQQSAINDLMRAVLHHVADEETRLLPAAEDAFDAQRLSELGAAMTRRRLQLAGPRMVGIAGDLALAAPAKAGLVTVGMLVAGTLMVNRMRHRRRGLH
jgi:anaerobic glycerol-3-phosphate dehydrogenase